MSLYKPRAIQPGTFPKCVCNCITYDYVIGQELSLSDLQIRTERGSVWGVRVARHRCAGCGLVSLVLTWIDSNGCDVFAWMLPIGKDSSGE